MPTKTDAIIKELIAAASEVKYKSQRLKDALRAAENVRKTPLLCRHPDGWVRYKSDGMSTFMDGAKRPDPKVYGSGWIALYRNESGDSPCR